MKVKKNDVSVRFEVKVPAGVRFVGRTVNGGISARGIQAEAEAHTVNGGIEIEARGLTHAETVNGGISARVDRADWKDTLQLKTVNGGIEVSLPASAAANVKAATVNGDIETDFPLTVTGKFGRRRIEGSIGGGGPVLEMETVNGAIKLSKAFIARGSPARMTRAGAVETAPAHFTCGRRRGTTRRLGERRRPGARGPGRSNGARARRRRPTSR